MGPNNGGGADGDRSSCFVAERSLAWMALAQGCSLVLQFAASVVLARYLTPYETGIYAVALTIVGILALMQALRLHSLIVREENLTQEIRTTVFTLNVCISLLLSLSIAAISLFGGSFLNDKGVQETILALAVTPLLGIFTFLPGAELERGGNFQTLALVGIASNVAGTIATITLAIRGFSYMSIAYAQWVRSRCEFPTSCSDACSGSARLEFIIAPAD